MSSPQPAVKNRSRFLTALVTGSAFGSVKKAAPIETDERFAPPVVAPPTVPAVASTPVPEPAISIADNDAPSSGQPMQAVTHAKFDAPMRAVVSREDLPPTDHVSIGKQAAISTMRKIIGQGYIGKTEANAYYAEWCKTSGARGDFLADWIASAEHEDGDVIADKLATGDMALPICDFAVMLTPPQSFYGRCPKTTELLRSLNVIVVSETEGKFLLLASFNPVSTVTIIPHVANCLEAECGVVPFLSAMRLRLSDWQKLGNVHFKQAN